MTLKIIKEVRDIKRFNHILIVLFDEGFDFLLSRIKLSRFIPFSKRIKAKLAEKSALPPQVRLRKTLERLGPTFIKFGQMLSVRPDLVPKDYIAELEKLQNQVPSFSFDKVKMIVEGELKKPMKEIFKSFDKNPTASASISQVHAAVLKNGRKVAVKVQRPDVKKTMESDIEIMLYIAKLAEEYMPEIRKYKPLNVVQEFSDWTNKELNFIVEARNAKRFYNNFKDSKTVRIPKVYGEYSTEKVLTLEFLEGVEIYKLDKIKRKDFNFNKFIINGFDAVLTQVFIHGFFHADPHPGNMLVMKNNAIAFLDFGIVGNFDKKLKNQSIEILYGIVSMDTQRIVRVLIEMSEKDGRDANKELLSSDIQSVVEPLHDSQLQDIQVSKVLTDVLDLALEHKIRLPMAFVLFGKTIVTLEGVGLKYNPEFKIIDQIKPFAEKLIKEKTSPKNIANELMERIIEFKNFFEKLPQEASGALEKIRKGEVKIDIDDTSIKKLSLEIDRSSNRLAYGMIIAALIVGGAILTKADGMPKILGINFLSFLLFLIAGIVGLVLFFSILSERKLR